MKDKYFVIASISPLFTGASETINIDSVERLGFCKKLVVRIYSNHNCDQIMENILSVMPQSYNHLPDTSAVNLKGELTGTTILGEYKFEVAISNLLQIIAAIIFYL